MKKYKLIYTPEPTSKRFLFTNVNIKDMNPPLSISRETPLQEEVVFNTKKKSEQIEYESEEYKKLKEKESNPLVLEDSEHRAYSGKLQDLGKNNICYFAFINTGSNLRVVPIRKWYRFTQKAQNEVVNTNEKDIEIADDDAYSSADDREEIDYNETFDDDDGEEAVVSQIKEKKLNKSGKEISNLMKNYEDSNESSEDDYKKESNEKFDEPFSKKVKTSKEKSNILTKDKIRRYFINNKISLKDLLKAIRVEFPLNEEEKNLIKEFIGESCKFEVDPETSDRILILK